MKNFVRRLIGDKRWYSLFEYENLPTFQALCLESKKLLDVQDRLISKLTDNNLDEFENKNDQKLYDSVQDRIDEISNKRCRVEGKIIATKFRLCDPPGDNHICKVIMETPSKGPGIPSTLEFYIENRVHGHSQLTYVKRLQKGQTIKLHGAFYCSSPNGIHDHQIIYF